MAEQREAFTSVDISSLPQQSTASAQSSTTTPPPGDSESGITTVEEVELTRNYNNDETGTASSSRQMEEHQEPLTPDDAIASPAQQPSPPTDESPSITIIIIGVVDELTRNVDKDEYNPQHVSIGPYHWIKTSHLKREEEKRASLRAILQSAGRSFTEAELLHELAPLEDRARSCYAHGFPQMDRRQRQFVRMLLLDGSYLLHRFRLVGQGRNDAPAAPPNNNADRLADHWVVRMLLLDGSYLLHLFRLVGCGRQGRNEAPAADAMANNGASEPPAAPPNNNVVDRRADHSVSVVRDVLYLAENQIPFFVLQKIHEVVVPGGNASASASASASSVADGMKRYVQELLLSQGYSVAKPEVRNNPPGNLLHLLHMHLQPTTTIERPEAGAGSNQAAGGMKVRRWRRATQYRDIAGVKLKQRPFREGAGHAKCILDVKLRGGTLWVPCLSFDNQTCGMLRNLMALEQANPGLNSHVTAYCVFISQLACTAADVELLSDSLIIDHTLGSDEEVAKCFADLCKGIVFDIDDGDSNYLRATCQQLEAWFQSRGWRWMAWLKRKYFSSPWAIIGLIAGTVGIFCTVVQAVYGYLGYKVSLRQK